MLVIAAISWFSDMVGGEYTASSCSSSLVPGRRSTVSLFFSVSVTSRCTLSVRKHHLARWKCFVVLFLIFGTIAPLKGESSLSIIVVVTAKCNFSLGLIASA